MSYVHDVRVYTTSGETVTCTSCTPWGVCPRGDVTTIFADDNASVEKTTFYLRRIVMMSYTTRVVSVSETDVHPSVFDVCRRIARDETVFFARCRRAYCGPVSGVNAIGGATGFC